MDFSYGEKVIVTPRKYPLNFRMAKELKEHFAIIGMGIVEDDYPLYYDATNEKGLSIAGLNFPVSAFINACTFENFYKNSSNFFLQSRRQHSQSHYFY